MTMPVLIQSNQKKVIETRLEKFNSMMGQAVTLSEIDNGMRTDWKLTGACDSEGSEDGYACNLAIYNKYFKNYLKATKTEEKDGKLFVYFADGSAARFTYYGHDILFFPDAKKASLDKVVTGRDAFLFGFYPGWCENNVRAKNFCNGAVEPYVGTEWDGTDEGLGDDCLNATKILQLNNWNIPEGYPCFKEKEEDVDDII